MTKRIAWLAFGLALATAEPAAGQRQPDRQGGDPVEMLVAISRELRLTETQVQSLREIQRRLEAANRPLVERLVEIQREVRPPSARDGRRPAREPTEAQLAAARPPLRRIQENNRSAMEEVNALLTSEQKRIASELLEVAAREMEERRRRLRLPRRQP